MNKYGCMKLRFIVIIIVIVITHSGLEGPPSAFLGFLNDTTAGDKGFQTNFYFVHFYRTNLNFSESHPNISSKCTRKK